MWPTLKKRIEKRYPCPVCGFGLKYPPEDFNICPSCGVEFGAETSTYTLSELRDNWVKNGLHWSSRVHSVPAGWNPWLQLIQAGLGYAAPRYYVEPAPEQSFPYGQAVISRVPLVQFR